MYLQKALYILILLLSLYFMGQTISNYKSVSTRLCNPVFKEERQKKLSQLEIILTLSIVLFIINAILLLECSIKQIKLSTNNVGISANIGLLITILLFSTLVGEDSMKLVLLGSVFGILLFLGYFGYEYYLSQNKNNKIGPTKSNSPESNSQYSSESGNSPFNLSQYNPEFSDSELKNILNYIDTKIREF